MGELTTLETKRGDLDRLTPVQRLGEAVEVANGLLSSVSNPYGMDSSSSKRIRAGLPKAKEFITSGALDALIDEYKRVDRPATKEQIGRMIGAFVAVFPNAGKSDLRMYGAALAIDVAAKFPTVAALESACRRLRQTARFLPSIAEFMDELENQEIGVKHNRWVLLNFRKYTADGEADLIQYEADVASWEARRVQAAERKAREDAERRAIDAAHAAQGVEPSP